jgi:hypothetical protein
MCGYHCTVAPQLYSFATPGSRETKGRTARVAVSYRCKLTQSMVRGCPPATAFIDAAAATLRSRLSDRY